MTAKLSGIKKNAANFDERPWVHASADERDSGIDRIAVSSRYPSAAEHRFGDVTRLSLHW
jgi:hypothetical protein